MCCVLHCRCICDVVHRMWVYVSCCTLGVGVCVALYTMCVNVVQCDGIGKYGFVWDLVIVIEGCSVSGFHFS